MKERIVVDNSQKIARASYYTETFEIGAINYVTPEVILNENRIVAIKEQVPESFVDLKELCKDIKGCYIGENYINLSEKWLSFHNDGQISCLFYNITNNATPQQMWQIIKGLIGE